MTLLPLSFSILNPIVTKKVLLEISVDKVILQLAGN